MRDIFLIKKMKYILLFVTLFLLASCGNSKDIETAKKELLSPNQTQDTSTQQTNNTAQDEQINEQENDDNGPVRVQVIPLWENNFLDFDDISNDFLNLWEVEISGNTIWNVESISVKFSNPTSSYPDDNYVLQTYKPEDWRFVYRASSRSQVLDYGENNYIFTAKSWDEISQTKIVLNVPAKDDEIEPAAWVEAELLWYEGNTLQIQFPTSSKYGEPIKRWEASFTYSGIKGFEANKEIIQTPTCDELSDYLKERLSSWYYWNTCRDIVQDFGIKYNVIRLDGEQYIYERHYIDSKHGIYATYELETWTWVTPDNIAEKNEELKEQEFPSIEVVDDLMKDIVNS